LTDIFINEPSTRTGVTCLKGRIRASAPELVRKLGQPQPSDGSKSFFEWVIESDNGIAIIYDWYQYDNADEATTCLLYNESPITWNVGSSDANWWQVLDDAGIEENQG